MTTAQAIPAASSRGARGSRVLLSTIVATTGLLMSTAWSSTYRVMEAHLAAASAGLAIDTNALGDRWSITTAAGDTLILVVTSTCTTSLLVVPLFVAATWLLLLQRMRPVAVLLGLATGLLVLLGLGTLRMCLIGLAWHRWGHGAIWVTHDVLGSLISVLAAAAALLVMLLVLTRSGRHEARRFTDAAVPADDAGEHA